MSHDSAGRRFREALAAERPLQIIGTINAYSALMAAEVGYRALYVSGAGVANASYGLPDLGLTSLENVLEDVRRITSATDRPVLVDIDTGWGGAFNIARSIDQMGRAGAAAVHIEDQVAQKRCGHRPNKEVVSSGEMCDRLKAALDARRDPDFFIMARSDALAVEGFDAALDRIGRYAETGADGIFAEAMTDIEMYRRVVEAVDVPVLANITEFGKTPLYRRDELARAGIAMVLYPLSAFRAMNAAALAVFRGIREHGTQSGLIERMQTRAELYEFLRYEAFERKLDALFADRTDGASDR